ncbi:hypothetical protein KIM372_13090 [Bombiscardovia nodaiensis]|uniref:Glycosyltransferase 2-like domain-containing protein n=1 Tax=Bombiscardovia nodaiensis TaxID=2932181 RepID=A0ABN6SE45_9BIFI|nr:hypothetical protein KIM372_13090 [Bombiscardovia nodaiensis]
MQEEDEEASAPVAVPSSQVQNQQPVLTVSIAAYNVEGSIRTALDSLLSPSVVPLLEVLVIDDGGSDGTLAIAREYQDRFPGCVRAIHKPNAGYGSVINTAIDQARGRYVKQLDGDDWFHTDSLVALVELLSHSQADYVLTPRLNVSADTGAEELVDCLPGYQPALYDFEDLSFTRAIGMHEVTCRTELLRQSGVRLDEHCLYTDIELVYLPLASVQTLQVTHLPLYCHRVGVDGQSISRSGVRAHYREHELVFWRLLECYQQLPEDKRGQRKLFRQRLVDEICGQFHWFCFLRPSYQHWKALRAFERQLQTRCPDLLEGASRASKHVRALRFCRGFFYPLVYILEAVQR